MKLLDHLTSILSEEDFTKFKSAMRLFCRKEKVNINVAKIDTMHKSMIIVAKQTKFVKESFHDKKNLHKKIRSLVFLIVDQGWKVHINIVDSKIDDTRMISADWINEQMLKHQIDSAKLCKMMYLDESGFQVMMVRKKGLERIERIAFMFFFRYLEHSGNSKI